MNKYIHIQVERDRESVNIYLYVIIYKYIIYIKRENVCTYIYIHIYTCMHIHIYIYTCIPGAHNAAYHLDAILPVFTGIVPPAGWRQIIKTPNGIEPHALTQIHTHTAES